MKVSAATRARARHFAVQAIYQWQLTENPVHNIEAEFHTDNSMDKVDVEYFHELLHGVVEHAKDLDGAFQSFLSSKAFSELDPVTLAILRMGSYELKHRIDVPYRVVINESVNLAKKFGAEDSHKFVNGVLDKTAATLRETEVTAARRARAK